MESILLNKLDEGEMEVIVVDDRSTDNSMTIVREYEKELNIRYVETTRSVHCAGNTRQAAFPYIRGEWFTCIDSDDSFEPDVLPKVKEFLENHDVKYTLCTNFRGYNPFKDQYDHSYLCEHCDTWLHGKFFNTKKTLIEFGCYFPEDLVSHEDTFFNCMNLANIIA
ncbi:MAG: glycosyltransferase family 2 protein, partial [Paludibacteraceae bacterium]|nr:glycosyltransferase family 2 protein [Paludibacteraceae bacterium]